jgi:putative transposase
MERPARKLPRLRGYDYTQNGAYFVTISTVNREILFGEIEDRVMRLDTAGEIVHACWNDLINHYPQAEYDAFVVMPNHIHALVILLDDHQEASKQGDDPIRNGQRPFPTQGASTNAVGTKGESGKRHGLSQIIGSLKSYSSKRINQQRATPGAPVWQSSFHDHIIRSEDDLNSHRNYILTNPARWQEDSDNPFMK